MTYDTGESDDGAVLDVAGLTVRLAGDDGPVHAVRDLTFRVHRGESVGVVGESGSGKSVAALATMGLLPRTASVTGSVRLHGRELLGLDDAGLSALRGDEIAMIFADPLTTLNPVHTIGHQLAEAVLVHNAIGRAAARRRAVELLGVAGVPDPRSQVDDYPHELSDGTRRRVAIAIAIANDPDVIIADEPTTALDVTVQAQVLESLETARAATGAALVLVTHDLGVIAGHADRVVVMYAGKAVEAGGVDEIFYTPRMPYTLGLLGSLPRLDRAREHRLTPIPGAPPPTPPPGCPFAPRCPMAERRCREEEPALRPIDGGPRTAACHFAEAIPADLFPPLAADPDTPHSTRERR